MGGVMAVIVSYFSTDGIKILRRKTRKEGVNIEQMNVVLMPEHKTISTDYGF